MVGPPLFVSTTTRYFSVRRTRHKWPTRFLAKSLQSLLLRQTKQLVRNRVLKQPAAQQSRHSFRTARTKEHAPLLCRKFPSWTTIGQFYVKAGLACKHCFSIGSKKRQCSSGYFLYHSASYVFYYESELKVSSPLVQWFLTAQQKRGDWKVLIWINHYKVVWILTAQVLVKPLFGLVGNVKHKRRSMSSSLKALLFF